MSFVKFTRAVLGLLALPASLRAQRQPVLPQIKVPHSYYYREMYLPQVTSGPSAVSWSPDGRELIYSMQGSLWRQQVGSKVTRQLTAGPGYDYQPDWSPDGRTVVYSSYHDDQIELRLLDLSTGQSRSLLADGAVNVEPRWSPDGRRIAFVSTAYEGRWHIFIAAVSPDGSLASAQRITEDRESGLPRYYYGTHDQYLSPTWSPDGQDLIFISNRGHVWGSGGFWRMPARPSAEPRELRFEETTWKARPDWSRDGKRVVYSSYLGRQWHQLWLITSEGGDPFQLTYGEWIRLFRANDLVIEDLLELLGRPRVHDVVDGDLRALLRQLQHDRLADAAVAAGDDGGLSREAHRARSSRSPAARPISICAGPRSRDSGRRSALSSRPPKPSGSR